MKEVQRARSLISDEEYKRIISSIEKVGNKASAEEQKVLEAGFEKSVKKVLKKYKPELISGYDQMANMSGRVLLRVLTKTNGFEGVIEYKIRA